MITRDAMNDNDKPKMKAWRRAIEKAQHVHFHGVAEKGFI